MATKKTPVQRRDDQLDNDEMTHRHQPISNALKIKLDHLKTFEPLTENQGKFFDLYRGGAYCIGMFGSPGVGKCQGEDVEVNLMVSDELFDILSRRRQDY